MLRHIMLCYIMLRYIMLRHNMLRHMTFMLSCKSNCRDNLRLTSTLTCYTYKKIRRDIQKRNVSKFKMLL